MWTYANKARNPSLEHPPQTLRSRDIRDKLHYPLLLGGAHDPRLNNVDRRAYRRSHEAREEGRREMRRKIVLERCVVEQELLEPIVCRQLSNCHEHRS